MANPKQGEIAAPSTLSVIVRRGVVMVDKMAHSIGKEVELLKEEAERLIGLGVVEAVNPAALAEEESSSAAVKPPIAGVTSTTSDGPSITAAQE